MAKFYNISRVAAAAKEQHAHYVVLMGGRNIGKSYQVKLELLKEAYINHTEIIYLRREAEDIKTDLCQGYFADVNIGDITDGEYDGIIVYQKKIYWCRHDEAGHIVEKKLLGHCHALRLATHYKSVMFPDVSDIIFEEFVPDGVPYLPHEPLRLQEYVSTIFRTKEGRCWLIGNTISKLNPYAEDWHLEGIGKMKTHQIDTYTQTVQVQTADGIETHDVKIIVESCGAEGLLSKMAFGSGANQIIKNEYRRLEQRTVEADFINNDCDCIYEMFMFYKNLKFKMQLMAVIGQDDRYFWYVKPAAAKLTQSEMPEDRIITDDIDFNPLHTGLHPISQKEKKVFDFLAKDKIFYSDDMTGTDFIQCFKALKRGG